MKDGACICEWYRPGGDIVISDIIKFSIKISSSIVCILLLTNECNTVDSLIHHI